METKDKALIAQVRSFSRFYTNIIGLLDKSILDSPYSLTQARILFEVGKMVKCTANELSQRLNIDRGYMSRILNGFEADGLINKEGSIDDGRVIDLTLTQKGKEELAMLEDRSTKQIEKLVMHLTDEEKDKLVESFKYIKKKLTYECNDIVIRDYDQKDIDFIINTHETLYQAEYNFLPCFTDYVSVYVNKFNDHHDKDRENIWIAEKDGKQVGVIAAVKSTEDTAQMRWFIIEPEARGLGLGQKMVDIVLDFCKDKGYEHIFLLTVSILGAARHIYSERGFVLTGTSENNEWANYTVIEERWELDL